MLKILIVDDHPHICDDLELELKSGDKEIFKANTVNEAKNFLSENSFDYAIIDLQLDAATKYAGYGGIEVIEFAKTCQNGIEIFIISATKYNYAKEQLTNNPRYDANAGKLLKEYKNNYIYKGGKKSYIDTVLEKLGIDDDLTWHGNYYALLIAVEDYLDKKICNLKYPISDAENLKDVLTRYYYFDENKIALLTNPKRGTILKQLDKYSKKLTPRDNLFIFYAGHGCWNDNREQGYWLPHDAHEKSSTNWISNGDLRDFIRGIDTQHTLLISDACFSGAIFKSRGMPDYPKTIEEKYKIRSRKAITSGDASQIVPDHSVFIQYLINNLKKNKEDYLYAEKLYTNICDEFVFSNLSSQNPVFGKIQHAGDDGGGDFIFISR